MLTEPTFQACCDNMEMEWDEPEGDGVRVCTCQSCGWWIAVSDQAFERMAQIEEEHVN